MNRYENGKIYMIESASAGLTYYGSTCMSLAKRLHIHRRNFGQYQKNGKSFITSFKVLCNEDHKIVLVEEVKCDNKQQLLAREAHYIRNHNCVNKVIPNRTQREYYQDNKEHISEQHRHWHQDHREQIQEYIKQYNEDNKERLGEYRKQYHEDNREEILQKHKQYYQNNQEKVTCECGSLVSKFEKSRHIKSKKHIKFISSMDQQSHTSEISS